VQRFWDLKIENHLKAGVSCDQVNNLRMAGAYLSKYLAKDEGDTPENQGRYWGCSRNWGEVVLNCAELTGNQLTHFRRLVKRFLKGNRRMPKNGYQTFQFDCFWSLELLYTGYRLG